MKKIVVLSFIAFCFLFASCQKEYICVCEDLRTGEKTNGDKVKTTNLGKKGFEKSCKSNSNESQDCYVK